MTTRVGRSCCRLHRSGWFPTPAPRPEVLGSASHLFRGRLAHCPGQWRLQAKAPGEPRARSQPTASSLGGPRACPPHPGPGGGRAGVSREQPAPAPRAQPAGDGAAGPGPRRRPYLPHVGRQLAPGVVVPDVELHVYVHGAPSPGRRGRPGPRLQRRLPPPALGLSGGPAGGPRSHRRPPAQPHGQGSRRLGAARAKGHGSRGDGHGETLAASSFFLVSPAGNGSGCASLPPAGARPKGRGSRLASGPALCTPGRGYEVMSRGTRVPAPPAHTFRLPQSLWGRIKRGAWVGTAIVG